MRLHVGEHPANLGPCAIGTHHHIKAALAVGAEIELGLDLCRYVGLGRRVEFMPPLDALRGDVAEQKLGQVVA